MVLIGLKEGNKTRQNKLIKSIKLYLQEIQVIHSVRKKAFKAHSKICTVKSSWGFSASVHKACNLISFFQTEEEKWGGGGWQEAVLDILYKQQTNFKVLELSVSFPFRRRAVAEQSSQSPGHATTKEEKLMYSFSKRHIGTCAVCVCVCVCRHTARPHS